MKEPKAKPPEKKAARILRRTENKADAGGLWISSLDATRKYQLMDFASQLSQLIPFSQSGITEEDFIARLSHVGHYESAIKVLKKLVGDLRGWIGPYEIFWSHRYAYYFVKFLRRGQPEEEARASTASRMELNQTDLLTRISRRDINALLNLFLMKSAEETEGKKMAMSLVESINTAQTEYNQCVNRQTKLLNELKEKRSQRLSKQIKENASILNLVEMWKDEESRHKMIKLAEIRKKALEEEVERLSSMDEIKCRIMGLTEEEVLNG